MTKKVDLIRQIIAPGENANFVSEDLEVLTDKEVLILLIRFSQWRYAIDKESRRRAKLRRKAHTQLK